MEFLRRHTRRFLEHGSFRKNVAVLAGGTALGQALTVLVVPALTRLYSPREMGTFAMFQAFVAFVSVAGALRYEAAIVSARDTDEASRLLLSCLLLVLPTSLLFALVLFGLIDVSLLGFGVLPKAAVFFAFPYLLGMCGYTVVRYWLIRAQDFKLLSQVSIVQGGRGLSLKSCWGSFRSAGTAFWSASSWGDSPGWEGCSFRSCMRSSG